MNFNADAGAAKFSRDAEEAVLGAILLSDRALEPLVTEVRLRPAHFYAWKNNRIYRAMLSLFDAGKAVDALTVKEEIDRMGHDDDDMPAEVTDAEIDELTAGVPNVGNVRQYAERVVELARWRQEQVASWELMRAAEEEDRERRDKAMSILLRPDPQAAEATSDPDALKEMMFAHLEAEEDEVVGWPFEKLNDLTAGGMRRGGVTYIGGWTSHGKSAFLDQILSNVGTQTNPRTGKPYRSWLYLNEMTRKERVCRLVSRESGVSFANILRNRLTELERRRVLNALDAIPFGMTECQGWSAEEIARDSRHRDVDIVAVDILHNIDHQDEGDLRRIAGTLLNLAVQGDCHVLCTIHLNTRRLQTAVKPAPATGDIRGSGMIGNLASNVMFVHRAQEEKSGLPQDSGWIYFAKVRNGQVGGMGVGFDGPKMRFTVPRDGFMPGQEEMPDAA